MLLIVAFALFLLIVSAWIVAPSSAVVRRREPVVPAGLPGMEPRSA